MMRRPAFLAGLALVLLAGLIVSWLTWRPLPGSQPVVCQQIAQGIRFARECRPEELLRVRRAYMRIARDVQVPVSPAAMAGLASFLVDGGRLKNTILLRLLNRGDIEGACDDLLRGTRTHGEHDERKAQRRRLERELCMTKG